MLAYKSIFSEKKKKKAEDEKEKKDFIHFFAESESQKRQ